MNSAVLSCKSNRLAKSTIFLGEIISRTLAETCIGWAIPHWFLVSFQFVAAYILSNSHVRQLNPRLFPSVSPQESQVLLLKPPFLSIFLVELQLFSISKRPRCSASSCHRCWGCHHSGAPVGWGRVSAHCLRSRIQVYGGYNSIK